MKFIRFLFSLYFLKHLGLAIGITLVLILGILLYLHIYTHHGQARPVPDFYGLTPPEAEEIAAEHKLHIRIIDSVYSAPGEPGTVVEQNPKAGFRVKKNRTVFITLIAMNPEMIVMPNLVGLTLRQANSILETSGLTLGRRIYVPDLGINNVLKQLYARTDIAEGDSIEKGSTIDLVLGKGLSDQRTIVPDMISLTLKRAESRILDASLNLGAVTFDNTVRNQDDSAKAFVWKQNPGHDERNLIQLGSPVYIWLTLDSAKLPVPDTLSVIIQDWNDE